MASWYDKLDSYLLGVLPGGVALGTSPSTLALADAAGMGAAIGSEPNAGANSSALAAFGGGSAAPARAGGGGRLMTAIARIYPDGSMQPVSMTPGGVALYRRDLQAVKRVKHVAHTLARIFPRRGSVKVVTRVRTVHVGKKH